MVMVAVPSKYSGVDDARTVYVYMNTLLPALVIAALPMSVAPGWLMLITGVVDATSLKVAEIVISPALTMLTLALLRVMLNALMLGLAVSLVQVFRLARETWAATAFEPVSKTALAPILT